MDARRKTILLLTVACCAIVLALPVLLSSSDPMDALLQPLSASNPVDSRPAPIGPLASRANQPPDPAMMRPLHAQASAALNALQTSNRLTPR
jgi:hypothetical protein